MIGARRGRFVLSRSFGKWLRDGIRVHGELRSVAVFGLPPALPSVVAVIVEEFLPGVRVAVHRSPTRFGGLRSAGSKHGAPAVEEEGTRKNV